MTNTNRRTAMTNPMSDADYVRDGVKLADDWSIVHIYDDEDWAQLFEDNTGIPSQQILIQEPTEFQGSLDALAAQLRKRAQSNPDIVFKISVADSAVFVEMLIYNPGGDEESDPLRFVAHEENEAIAFLKVIVDSGVLKEST